VQQYFQNNKKVPFIVRRRNWSNIYGILITSVKPRETSNGWFGDVFGYPLLFNKTVLGNSWQTQ
jgi:hypothetical protein